MRKYSPKTHPVIAIDLDGTIVPVDAYPELGVPYDHAIETINEMVNEGYEVIIWTARGWDNAKKAFQGLGEKFGLNTDKIKLNSHSDFHKKLYPVSSPKIDAHVFLDDKSYNAPIYKEHWKELHKEFIGKEL